MTLPLVLRQAQHERIELSLLRVERDLWMIRWMLAVEALLLIVTLVELKT